jgi:hypothetical protein
VQSLAAQRLRLLAHAARALGLTALAALASCGGSSSETPPPLEPLPVNVHYSRAATTLPGELGTSVKAPADDAAALPAEPVETMPPPAAPPKGKPAAPTK